MSVEYAVRQGFGLRICRAMQLSPPSNSRTCQHPQRALFPLAVAFPSPTRPSPRPPPGCFRSLHLPTVDTASGWVIQHLSFVTGFKVTVLSPQARYSRSGLSDVPSHVPTPRFVCRSPAVATWVVSTFRCREHPRTSSRGHVFPIISDVYLVVGFLGHVVTPC